MGKKYHRKTKMRITTKNAISKSELRAARRREEYQINEATSSKREIKNQQNKEESDMLASANVSELGAVGIPADKETIINEFKTENLSIPIIADNHGMNDSEILSILICDAYTEGFNILDCAKKFNTTKYQVQKYLKLNNIQTRKRGCRVVKNDDEIVEAADETVKTDIEATEPEKVEKDIDTNMDQNEDSETKLEPTNNTIVFCEQSFKNQKLDKLDFNKYSQDIFVAGLCRNRHDMPVNKYIFDTLNEEEIDNPKYIESRALGFINAYVRPKPTMPAKTLVLYCTGFALALSTIVKVCIQNRVNLLTMHYNPHTNSYTPQNTVDIFGKIPTIDEISPLKGLEGKYKGGIYLFGCKTKHLVEQANCTFITLQDDYYPNRNSIILFPVNYPTTEIWELYSEMIKLSRNDGFVKRQNIQLGFMKVSLSGYIWGDVISKSYNWKDEKPITKRII